MVEAFRWENELSTEELGQEGYLGVEVGVGYALVFGAAALFDVRVESGRDEGLEDEEVDGHVAVERKLEAVGY